MTSAIALQIEAVILAAEDHHSPYPQYEGHWRTPEWRPVRLKRGLRTKFGRAFEKGDLTIARQDRGPEFVTVYSFRNGIDTSVRAGDAEWLDGKDACAMEKTLWQYQCQREGTLFYLHGMSSPPDHLVSHCPVCGSKRIKCVRAFPGFDEAAGQRLDGKERLDAN